VASRAYLQHFIVGLQRVGLAAVKRDDMPFERWHSYWWYYRGGVHASFVDNCTTGEFAKTILYANNYTAPQVICGNVTVSPTRKQ
jgi:hypothetical protein